MSPYDHEQHLLDIAFLPAGRTPEQDAAVLSQHEADRLREQFDACPGIEIEPGAWSGCNAHQTGATDCPTCGDPRWRVAGHKRDNEGGL